MSCNGPALPEQLERMLLLDDSHWYREMLLRSPARPLPEQEQDEILRRCILAAEEQLAQMPAHWQRLGPAEALRELGYRVRYEDQDDLLPIFALCDPREKTVTVNTPMIRRTRRLLAELADDRISGADVEAVALWHEVYHALEDRQPHSYTRSRMLHRKLLGLFPYSAPLDAAGEIAAIHFSGRAAGLPWCPCILEHVALAALGRSGA